MSLSTLSVAFVAVDIVDAQMELAHKLVQCPNLGIAYFAYIVNLAFDNILFLYY